MGAVWLEASTLHSRFAKRSMIKKSHLLVVVPDVAYARSAQVNLSTGFEDAGVKLFPE